MSRLIFILVGLLLCIVSATKIPFFGDEKVPPLPAIRSDPAKYRLPKTTTPSNYVLILKIDPNKHDSFGGKVEIDVRANLAENNITLHSNGFNITKVSVSKDNGSDIYESHTLSEDDTHFLTITLKENLVINDEYKITIDYLGKYGTNLRGLYLSSYIQSNGTRRYLTATQFEAIHAREAFPCYDEPGLKAIFQTNIYVPSGYHAICNTEQTNVTSLPPQEDGLFLYSFAPTVKMPSYLVAFVVSDFIFVSNEDPGQEQLFPKLYRVFAKPSSIEHTKFALDFGQKNIAAIEKYTNVSYALSKLDNIGVPDFFAGAMENWGLVIYGELNLFDEPGVTSTRQMQRVATVISHENGHLWFGDEVTPEWWDYTWLSESLATYMEYYGIELVTPEWRMMDQYVPLCIYTAMAVDSLPTTNAMTSSVSSPAEIDSNFNAIAYQKSGSVMRMMEHVMGTNNFQKGIRNYLKSIPKGSGTPDILFEGLQSALTSSNILPAGKTIKDVLGLWSETPGFPILHAKRSVGDRSIILRQERYYQDKSLSSNEKWYIPISWAVTNDFDFENTAVQEWFLPDTAELVVEMNLRDNAWYILNKQMAGYYRVLYEDNNWERLTEMLQSENFKNIHILNRIQLIDDSLEFARTLRMSYNTTLNLLYYLKEEVDYIAWLTVNPRIMFLDTMLPAAENYDLFREYVRQIVKKAYENVGFEVNEEDTPDVKMNRNILMTIACTFDIEDCREKSRDVLEKISVNAIDIKSIDPDVRSVIYCAGMRGGSNALWNSFWTKYMNFTSDSEKSVILRNLACSENDEIIKGYLSKAVEKDLDITETHRRIIVESVTTSGYIGVKNVVDFVTENFISIKEVMLEASTVSIINTLRSRIVTEENVEQFESFAESFGNFSANEKNAMDIALITIRQNREWLEDVLYDVDPWLLENVRPDMKQYF